MLHRNALALPLAELGQMFLDQPMHPQPLQLGRQHQDLVGAQWMILVDDLQHRAQRRLELGVVRRWLSQGQDAPRRASAASCMVSGSKS